MSATIVGIAGLVPSTQVGDSGIGLGLSRKVACIALGAVVAAVGHYLAGDRVKALVLADTFAAIANLPPEGANRIITVPVVEFQLILEAAILVYAVALHAAAAKSPRNGEGLGRNIALPGVNLLSGSIQLDRVDTVWGAFRDYETKYRSRSEEKGSNEGCFKLHF